MPQPVNLTVDIFTQQPRYQFIQRGCFVHALMISRFRKSTCRFSSSGKRAAPTGGSRREYWQFHLRSATHESTECGFHHFSGVSGIFQPCASACARVSRWRSYSIVPGGDLSRWPAAVLQLPGAAFRSNFSIPFGIPSYNGGRVIKHPLPLPPPRRTGIPCSCQF